jgi:ubiquinone/menaquinone biosynthesis C-methylase UbiE
MTTSLVQRQFGANAEKYVQSQVHARGQSLAHMVALAEPQAHWLALDVAPGGGHSAIAIARRVARVIAVDITFGILQAARGHARGLGLENLVWVQGDGGALPLADAGFDLVTCRVALHHFPDQAGAIGDWARVLRPGGRLVLVDNIGPDEPAANEYVNAFEKIRDPSHGWLHPLAELEQFVRGAGLTVGRSERLTKPMAFHPWMERMQVGRADRLLLADMLWGCSGPARAFLSPQGDGDDTTFNLREGIILAQKPGGDGREVSPIR